MEVAIICTAIGVVLNGIACVLMERRIARIESRRPAPAEPERAA